MAAFNQTQIDPATAQGVIRGNRDAVDAAYRSLSQPVMNMATRILQDRGLAEEIVQDTFIDLVEKGAQIRAPEAVVGWVKSVATTHCLMKLRSPWMARRSGAAAEDVLEEQPAQDNDAWTQAQTIEQALALLPAETRAVLWLHDVEGYTHREIGSMMGKTTSFSKSQLSRGYERLLAWSAPQESPAPIRQEMRQDAQQQNIEEEVQHGQGSRFRSAQPPCAS